MNNDHMELLVVCRIAMHATKRYLFNLLTHIVDMQEVKLNL
jgi:hypothetical protein